MARTATRTSPRAGSGVGTSWMTSCSGPPKSAGATMRVMAVSTVLPGRRFPVVGSGGAVEPCRRPRQRVSQPVAPGLEVMGARPGVDLDGVALRLQLWRERLHVGEDRGVAGADVHPDRRTRAAVQGADVL